MKLIIVNQRHGHTRSYRLSTPVKGLLAVLALAVSGSLFTFGYSTALVRNPQVITLDSARNWQQDLQRQGTELSELKQHTEMHIDALAVRLAKMQAELARLEGVGSRVVAVAGFDGGEFDFSQPVGVGGAGADIADAESYSIDGLTTAVDRLERQIEDRGLQLEIIESVLEDRRISEEASPGGQPLDDAWISSSFGHRTDPFTGRRAFHGGIDFSSGGAGSDINSIAAGVVVWAGPRSNYGQTVDIDHGNGYMTRYAHASKVLVEVGDLVKKGDTIALVGSTGRSTSPHLHLEVYKDGRIVNPWSLVHDGH